MSAGLSGVWRPTREQLAAAEGHTIEDVLGPGLQVLFVGINPSLYSAAVGHHFARPGNRFWKVLHQSGFTPRQLHAFEDADLARFGLGVTNLVARATAAAEELDREELRLGAEKLREKVRQWRPRLIAFVGVQAYRQAFGRPSAVVGPSEEALEGARIWVLPNTSGLQAHYQLEDMVRLFGKLRQAAFSGPLAQR